MRKKDVDKKMNLKVVATLCIISLMAIGLFAAIPLVKSSPLDDALTLAKAYLDRSYTELNSTHAVMKDLPAIPFALHNVDEDKWLCPAKKTQAVEDDGTEWDYYGGCFIDIISFGYDSDRIVLRYRWDTEWDRSYDGVVMNATLITVDNDTMRVNVYIESKADGDECDIYLDNSKFMDDVVVDEYATRTNDWGWFSTRFVVRHGTAIARNMYNALGETSKADRLNETWVGSGFTIDSYDAMWNASNSYSDYMPLFINGSGVSKPWSATFNAFPDFEVWGNIPWSNYDNHAYHECAVPYRSQLQFLGAVQTMLLSGEPIFPYQNWWELGWTFKLGWANHLMNKHSNNTSKMAEAKGIIDSVPWNGLGINAEVYSGVQLWKYGCYVTYLASMYLRALSRYYEITSASWYGDRADDVAGVLLNLQVEEGEKIRVTSGSDVEEVWRADHTGGFLCGYRWGGGWDWSNAPFWFAELIFEALSWEMGVYEGLYHRDLAENSAMGWTNHETTLLAYAGLWYYERLNRSPTTCSVEFTIPIYDSVKTVTHSDHGTSEIDIDDHGHARMKCVGTIYGETWVKWRYSWTVNLTDPAYNFSTKIVFYTYAGGGLDGNSLEIWVNLTDSQDADVASEYKKFIDGIAGDDEDFWIFENMSYKSYLSARVYTLNLTFRLSCGWNGKIYLGYMGKFPQVKKETMFIETFGYEAKFPQCGMKTETDGNFYIPKIHTDVLKVEKLFSDSDIEGDQTGGVSPYEAIGSYPDGTVDIFDLVLVCGVFGKSEGDQGWNYMADIVDDRLVDIFDQTKVALNFGNDGTYITDLSGVTIVFDVGGSKSLDADGFVAIPAGATSFTVKRYGNPIGAMISFWS